MDKLEQAYLDWIQQHDLFNYRDRERIAREFAAIAREFGAETELPVMDYKKVNGVDGYLGPDIPHDTSKPIASQDEKEGEN